MSKQQHGARRRLVKRAFPFPVVVDGVRLWGWSDRYVVEQRLTEVNDYGDGKSTPTVSFEWETLSVKALRSNARSFA